MRALLDLVTVSALLLMLLAKRNGRPLVAVIGLRSEKQLPTSTPLPELLRAVVVGMLIASSALGIARAKYIINVSAVEVDLQGFTMQLNVIGLTSFGFLAYDEECLCSTMIPFGSAQAISTKTNKDPTQSPTR